MSKSNFKLSFVSDSEMIKAFCSKSLSVRPYALSLKPYALSLKLLKYLQAGFNPQIAHFGFLATQI